MSTLAERIRGAREAAGIRYKSELARRVGVSSPTVTDWESGEINELKADNLFALCKVLNVRPEWLLSGRLPMHPQSPDRALEAVREPQSVYAAGLDPRIAGKVPLISWVQAGQADLAIDLFAPGDADEWYYCNARHSEQTYALRVRGDSMTAPYGRSYPDGCIIFVDPEKRGDVALGDPIIAKISGVDAATFKALARDDGRAFLKPLNPQYPPLFDEFRPLGKVIEKLENP